MYTVSRMMPLKEVFYFLTTISLALPTPYRYLIETGDDQSKSGLDNDCVDKDGKVKESALRFAKNITLAKVPTV